jgi:serine/threonine-protein kinase HipA
MTATERRDLAMICGRYGRHANAKNLLSECGRFLYKPNEAAEIIRKMKETVQSSWKNVCIEAGVSEADCAIIKNAFVYPGFSYETI